VRLTRKLSEEANMVARQLPCSTVIMSLSVAVWPKFATEFTVCVGLGYMFVETVTYLGLL